MLSCHILPRSWLVFLFFQHRYASHSAIRCSSNKITRCRISFARNRSAFSILPQAVLSGVKMQLNVIPPRKRSTPDQRLLPLPSSRGRISSQATSAPRMCLILLQTKRISRCIENACIQSIGFVNYVIIQQRLRQLL